MTVTFSFGQLALFVGLAVLGAALPRDGSNSEKNCNQYNYNDNSGRCKADRAVPPCSFRSSKKIIHNKVLQKFLFFR